jgi:hypothetical protein
VSTPRSPGSHIELHNVPLCYAKLQTAVAGASAGPSHPYLRARQNNFNSRIVLICRRGLVAGVPGRGRGRGCCTLAIVSEKTHSSAKAGSSEADRRVFHQGIPHVLQGRQ